MMEGHSKEELEEFEKNGFLTTHLAIDASIHGTYKEIKDREIPPEYVPVVQLLDKIHKAVDEFNVEVWLKWLYSHQAFEDHGFLEANTANVSMLVGSSAGRVMITLRWRDADEETKHHFISLLGADKLTLMDDYKPKVVNGLCGFQGIGMNGDRAVELLLEAARLTSELRENIHPSQGASFA